MCSLQSDEYFAFAPQLASHPIHHRPHSRPYSGPKGPRRAHFPLGHADHAIPNHPSLHLWQH